MDKISEVKLQIKFKILSVLAIAAKIAESRNKTLKQYLSEYYHCKPQRIKLGTDFNLHHPFGIMSVEDVKYFVVWLSNQDQNPKTKTPTETGE